MGNNIKSTSITTPITSDTLQANVAPMPFTQMDKVLANTNIQEINGLISREIIKEYFENQYTGDKEKLHLKTLYDDKMLSINFWQYANELYEIFKKYENGNIEADGAIKAIDGHIKEIVNILEQFKSRYKDTFRNTKLDNIEIKTTQDLFAKGKEQIEELQKDIKKAKTDAQMLAKNQTYKTIFKLAGLTFYCSHSSLVLSFANQYLRNRAILWMARICLGISPYLAVASLIVLALYSIYKLATNNNDLKISIFEFYCVLNAIMRQSYHYDGVINALVNFDKGVSGNIIAFGDSALRYFTSPLPYDSKLIDSVRANFIDEAMLYKIPNVKNYNDIINNVFSLLEQNNLNTQNSKANNGELFAFSTFPNIAKDSVLRDSDITNTSAFRHLKNITTQFSNFLLIQSPHFASGLMLDMLLQSFKTSPQNNQFIENKFALFITNPSEVNSMHYKIEKHIRSICDNSLQYNTLFLNTINCVEKKAVFERFKQQISDNYKKLEAHFNEKYSTAQKIRRIPWWRWLLSDPAKELNVLLQNLCNNCDNKDILTIADNFNAISKLVFEQEHLSDEKFHQEVPRAKEYYKNILETLLAFEKLFSYFVDFGIKQDDDNKINDKDLQKLRDQVRAKLKNQDTELSETAFYISNIINNAYFSNTPDNEIQHLKILSKSNNAYYQQYQQYKKIIEQYEAYPEKQRFPNAIKTILPFHKEILLDFFSEDEFDELCKFILYLIDLETGGAFLYYMHTSSILLEEVSKISKEDLKEIAKKSSNKSLQKLAEDKVTESMTNFIKNDFAAFLVGLVLKDVKENVKAKIKETLSNMECDSRKMSDAVHNHIITDTNMTRLDVLLKNIGNLDKLTQDFQGIQKIQGIGKIDTININEIDKILTSSNAPAKIFHTISKILKSNKSTDWLIIFSLYDWLLEKIFPTISKEDVKRQITLFMLGIRTKKNQEYAKWEKGKSYFYIPKNLNKSLIIGDFMHSLLLDTPLNIGYCIHNPSIGAYTKNKDLAQNHFKDIIKSNLYPYDVRYFPQDQDSESSRIYKEAYIKVHSYIGNISYPLDPATKQENIPSFDVFINNKNKKRIRTKLKYQKPQNDKQYQDKGESTNAQKDFIIQLKRVAEWSYRVYKGEKAVEINAPGWAQKAKNNKLEPSIVSNFIYNEHFVRTQIDIHKDL